MKCLRAKKVPLLRNWVSELPCKTHPFETVVKISARWCSHHLVHRRKDIHSGHAEKPQNDRLCASAATKKMSWQNASAHDRHSISHWWNQSVSQKWSIIHQFDILSFPDTVSEAYGLNVILLQQLLSAICRISGEFIIPLDSDAAQRLLQAISFLATNFATKCWSIVKRFWKKTRQLQTCSKTFD